MRRKFEASLSPDRLKQFLRNLGIVVSGETSTDLITYCQFHKNTDSPSFNISKVPPHLFRCWNGSCDVRGDLLNLLLRKGYSESEARSLIIEGTPKDDFVKLIESLLSKQKDAINEDWFDINVSGFKDEDKNAGYPALRYLKSRGVEDRSYDYFGMGYSNQKEMLVIPIFSEYNRPIGVVGRSIQYKRYEYSKGLDRNHTIWNLNNAKRTGSRYIILTEGTLDAVYIWQAGYESVGAVFGSNISVPQMRLVVDNFQELVIFSDNDPAGWALRDQTLQTACGILVSTVIYPDERKDPGELTVDEIRFMIETRKTAVELELGRILKSKL